MISVDYIKDGKGRKWLMRLYWLMVEPEHDVGAKDWRM